MSNAEGDDTTKCAACGESSDSLKACMACKTVKYCNKKCQKAHWRKHKKECTPAAIQSDPWLTYEHLLDVEVPTRSTNFNLDSLLSRRFNFEEDQHEDTSVPLPLRLENALTNNLYIADAYGVGDAMPPKSDWIAWATYISEKFPERAKLLSDEVEKDHLLNGQLLDNLSNETREGYSGSRTYISALNYSLHDAFRRCSLPSPPGINLDAAVSLRGDPLYKAQMRSWSGYKMRVFGLMDIINKAASSEKGQESLDSSLPDIFPAERRKPMTNALTRYLKRNEANYPREYESDGDY